MLESNIIIEKQLNGLYPKPGKTGVDWFIFCLFLKEFNENNLEIGVGHGGSAISMSSYSKNLTLVDFWKQTWEKEKCKRFLKNANFIDVNSKEFVTHKKLNLVHLDANKDYKGTLNDLYICEKVDAEIIIVDDFLQSFWPNISYATFDFVKKSNYKIIFVGNHQAILSKNFSSQSYKELIINFPVVITDGIAHLTYGKFPNIQLLNKMIEKSNLLYSWHETNEKNITNEFDV